MPITDTLRAFLRQLALQSCSRLQTRKLRFAFIVCVVIAGIKQVPAGAQLALTPATAADGWTLSTFASGFPVNSYNEGPLGVAFTDTGTVLVTDDDGSVRVFPDDTDGQLATHAHIGQVYGAGNASALARIGSKFYLTQQPASLLIEINPDGTFHQNIASVFGATGMVVNPLNGHLFITRGNFQASSSPVIVEVDPVRKTVSTFLKGPYSGDGLATDGNILYVTMNTDNNGGHILGYRIRDKSLVFDSGYLLGTDGCALGAGSLAGKLFVNTNYGQVVQIDLTTMVITLIASGGTRGDYVTVDPNGTLLVTQTDRILRLTPPAGSNFEDAAIHLAPSTVPGGVDAVGSVELTAPSPIDLVVSLVSTNAAATVPKSLTIPAGSISALFTIATKAVSSITTGDITVTLNGIRKSAKLTVRPIGIKSLVLQPTSIKGGGTVTGTVTLEGMAAPGPITVVFASSDTAVAPTPASVTIPAGQQSATFVVITHTVSATTTVTLTATANSVATSAKLVATP